METAVVPQQLPR